MVSAKPAQGAEPVQCSGAAKIKPPFEMGVDNFEEGVDISCVQELLGHSSIKTTRIYVHVSARIQAEILRTMHPRKKMKINTAA